MASIRHVTSVTTIVDLKTFIGYDKNPVLVLGKTTVGDGMAAHYYWDDTSTEVEDSIYLNTVAVTDVPIGRWKKVIARIVTIYTPTNSVTPYSYLVYNGGKKEVFIPATTIADGTATVYLTMNGTASGAPILNEVWFDDSKATVNTSAANDAVSSTRKSISSDLKTLTHLFFRGNSTAVSILGINVLSFRNAVAGTAVQFKVEGI